MTTRQELYDRIRESSGDEVILEEMIRLGFWPRGENTPDDPATEIQRRGELRTFAPFADVREQSPAKRGKRSSATCANAGLQSRDANGRKPRNAASARSKNVPRHGGRRSKPRSSTSAKTFHRVSMRTMATTRNCSDSTCRCFNRRRRLPKQCRLASAGYASSRSIVVRVWSTITNSSRFAKRQAACVTFPRPNHDSNKHNIGFLKKYFRRSKCMTLRMVSARDDPSSAMRSHMSAPMSWATWT